jgi:hypothetical protein
VTRCFERYRMKARVFKSGSASRLRDRSIDRLDRQDKADATPQISLQVKRGEHAASFG